jgi:hypothetical protein
MVLLLLKITILLAKINLEFFLFYLKLMYFAIVQLTLILMNELENNESSSSYNDFLSNRFRDHYDTDEESLRYYRRKRQDISEEDILYGLSDGTLYDCDIDDALTFLGRDPG